MTAAIRAEHVAKSYLVRRERRRTLKEQLLRQYGPRQRVEALKDVTFAVEPGGKRGRLKAWTLGTGRIEATGDKDVIDTTLVPGQYSDVKQQIVFTGDILNTAARLEEYAKHTGFDLVVSGAVLDRLTLPAGITAAPCGDLALRGKEASVSAYGLTRSERAA